MKVYGYEVPQEVIDACLARMRTGSAFTSIDIARAAVAAGAPYWNNREEYVAHRIADRLLQRERKAGRIEFNGKRWRMVEGRAAK